MSAERVHDTILSAIADAETAFEEGHRDGDLAMIHIDDLRAIQAVLSAAWSLANDTEGTVFTDEFGDHYRVPKAQWDSLALAVAVEREGRLCAENSAQRLYEQNGDPRMIAALSKLIVMWEGDDWITQQEDMLAIARAALTTAGDRS